MQMAVGMEQVQEDHQDRRTTKVALPSERIREERNAQLMRSRMMDTEAIQTPQQLLPTMRETKPTWPGSGDSYC